MSDVISGLWVAIATPLDADGNVDHPTLVKHGLWLLDQDCDGLVPFGTTGEGPSFSAAERLAATEALLKAGIPREKIALGTGCAAITDTISLTRQALALGLTHVLMLPPFYFRDAPPEGIEDAFAAIFDGVGSNHLRATLYHIPQVSGVAVPAAVLGRLRSRYGKVVAGVKDSTGDFASALAFRAAAPDCATLVGAEADIARLLAAGGTGTICGMANLVPALVRTMFSATPQEAAIRAAVAEIASGPFLPRVKAALASLSGDPIWRNVRAPLRATDAGTGARIAAVLKGLQTSLAA
jgi:4-hydroxy-tetrahydrodipicolinate synthase